MPIMIELARMAMMRRRRYTLESYHPATSRAPNAPELVSIARSVETVEPGLRALP